MAEFVYEARDKFGKLVKGAIGGESVHAVSNRLQSAGFIPVRIDRKTIASHNMQIPLFGGVRLTELNLFTRQLLTLQRAGLPLLAGLRSIEEQTSNHMLKRAITHVIIDIEGGLSLHEALARQPAVFDYLFVNMVEAGEASGRLDDVLERIAFLNERNEETRSKIKAALRYPALTCSAMVAAFVLIITIVMPKFVALFGQFQAQLPLPTRILLFINSAVREYWMYTLAVILLVGWLFRKYIRTKKGEYRWHAFILRLPVFGPLLHEIYMSRFARNLATLIESGLPILQALELVGNTVANAVIKEATDKIQLAVREGRNMSEPMKESKLFTSMVVQMISIGEETGKVDDLLNHVAGYYDRETDIKIKNLTSLLEPMLICVMGGLVLLLALGVFLPMWNLINLFKKG